MYKYAKTDSPNSVIPVDSKIDLTNSVIPVDSKIDLTNSVVPARGWSWTQVPVNAVTGALDTGVELASSATASNLATPFVLGHRLLQLFGLTKKPLNETIAWNMQAMQNKRAINSLHNYYNTILANPDKLVDVEEEILSHLPEKSVAAKIQRTGPEAIKNILMVYLLGKAGTPLLGSVNRGTSTVAGTAGKYIPGLQKGLTSLHKVPVVTKGVSSAQKGFGKAKAGLKFLNKDIGKLPALPPKVNKALQYGLGGSFVGGMAGEAGYTFHLKHVFDELDKKINSGQPLTKLDIVKYMTAKEANHYFQQNNTIPSTEFLKRYAKNVLDTLAKQQTVKEEQMVSKAKPVQVDSKLPTPKPSIFSGWSNLARAGNKVISIPKVDYSENPASSDYSENPASSNVELPPDFAALGTPNTQFKIPGKGILRHDPEHGFQFSYGGVAPWGSLPKAYAGFEKLRKPGATVVLKDVPTYGTVKLKNENGKLVGLPLDKGSNIAGTTVGAAIGGTEGGLLTGLQKNDTYNYLQIFGKLMSVPIQDRLAILKDMGKEGISKVVTGLKQLAKMKPEVLQGWNPQKGFVENVITWLKTASPRQLGFAALGLVGAGVGLGYLLGGRPAAGTALTAAGLGGGALASGFPMRPAMSQVWNYVTQPGTQPSQISTIYNRAMSRQPGQNFSQIAPGNSG